MLTWLLSNRGRISALDICVMLFTYTVILLFALPFHEWAHALVADRLGDHTARWQGRLSLNPARHLDPFGAAALVLVGIGYARPVPVSPRNFRNPKTGMALTALAGPLSNLFLAFVAMAAYRVLLLLPLSAYVQYIAGFGLVSVFASVNISLAVFNLLPVPPLDGSRLLALVLPDRWTFKLMQYQQYITWGLLALLLLGVFDVPLYYLRSGVFTLFSRLLFF